MIQSLLKLVSVKTARALNETRLALERWQTLSNAATGAKNTLGLPLSLWDNQDAAIAKAFAGLEACDYISALGLHSRSVDMARELASRVLRELEAELARQVEREKHAGQALQDVMNQLKRRQTEMDEKLKAVLQATEKQRKAQSALYAKWELWGGFLVIGMAGGVGAMSILDNFLSAHDSLKFLWPALLTPFILLGILLAAEHRRVYRKIAGTESKLQTAHLEAMAKVESEWEAEDARIRQRRDASVAKRELAERALRDFKRVTLECLE